MVNCSKCKKYISDLYFHCRYCGKNFCPEHRLPEDHDCEGLKKLKEKNKERWSKAVTEEVTQKFISKDRYDKEKKKETYPKKSNFWRFIKKNLFAIFLIFLLIFIFLYAKGFLNPLVDQWKCDDGTWYNHCSNNKPMYCDKGNLINNATLCGCPYGYREKLEVCEKIPTCSDGSFYSECSSPKPLYCENGKLIEKATICGCSRDKVISGERCISKYELNPKKINLFYFNYEVYGGLNDYLAGLDRSISYYYTPPTTKDFILKSLDNSIQKEYLIPLVEKIKIQSTNPKEQARIAISIVQRIPYDMQAYNLDNVEGRYPYEVLYDMKGVCGEKSDLLIFLLRELGFGVSVFEFETENHRAVGIKCNKGNYDSEYCFIESTDVYPIGQIPYDYVGGVDIRNAIPEIIIISEGESY